MYRRTMYRRAILWGLLLAAVAPLEARAVTAEAYMCRNGARERRVELQHPDAPDRLPCQVVYWRDAARSDEHQSLWDATHDFGFCIEHTRALVQQLQDAGWKCDKATTVQAEMQTHTQAIPALAPSRLPAASDTERAKLGEALARDMQRLARLTPGGHFEIESAELGDLNHDGKADAAVLLSYQMTQSDKAAQPDQTDPSGKAKPAGIDQPESAQFLLVYRSDGDTFQPAAKAYVGGPNTDVVASSIERIRDGAIELLLEVRQPGDLECCPSGRRREAFVLENDALVLRRPES
jgi:hypothetical protein